MKPRNGDEVTLQNHPARFWQGHDLCSKPRTQNITDNSCYYFMKQN